MAAPLSGVNLGINGGTLGVGPDVGYHQPGALFGGRFDANFGTLSHSFDSSGVHYAGKLHASTEGVTLDVYPFHNGFHLSAGIRNNDNEIDVTATGDRPLVLGLPAYQVGTRVVAAQKVVVDPATLGYVRGKVAFNPIAPYLGVGYNATVYRGIRLSVDAGVLYQGEGRLSLDVVTPLSGNPYVEQYLNNEMAVVRDKVHSYLHDGAFYPVLQIGVGYQF